MSYLKNLDRFPTLADSGTRYEPNNPPEVAQVEELFEITKSYHEYIIGRHLYFRPTKLEFYTNTFLAIEFYYRGGLVKASRMNNESLTEKTDGRLIFDKIKVIRLDTIYVRRKPFISFHLYGEHEEFETAIFDRIGD